MGPIFYDLTELYLSSGVKARYYGIARTVQEVGYELARGAAGPRAVRFVVHSPGHRRFFEVTPRVGPDSPTGLIDPDFATGDRPIRLRRNFAQPNILRDLLGRAVHPAVDARNRRGWDRAAPGHARLVDLHGETLVALTRPKIMSEYLKDLAEAGQHPVFYPLLHDMIPMHPGDAFGEREFSRNFAHDNSVAIRHARGILANSGRTREDIARFAASGDLPPLPPVTVTPLCHEMRAVPQGSSRPAGDPYVLSVGIQLGRKNLECVTSALLALHRAGRPVPRYVIAGAPRRRVTEHVGQGALAPIADRISFVSNPTDAELAGLYRDAEALIIASRLEGWGLPLGEALWLGTPAVAARAGALDEVGGDLAVYFNPDDPESLAAILHRLGTDRDYRASLRARIAAARGSLRTWADTARDIARAVA